MTPIRGPARNKLRAFEPARGVPRKQPALTHRKGWRMPENTLKVCRPGKWGNPFSAEEFGRAEAVARYADHLQSQLASGVLDLTELRGHNLACWCSLDGPCHAELLLRQANAS